MMVSRTGRCVVFDLDDTLYDEMDFVRSGFLAAADAITLRYGLDCRRELLERIASGELAAAFQDVAAGLQLPAESIPLMVDAYRHHAPALEARDGIPALLERLRARDGVVACLTDGRSAVQRAKLDALGIGGFIDVLMISEETGHSKPDAHNFVQVMQSVQASEFWYVADNPSKDFIAPNALGWRTVGVWSPRGLYCADHAKHPPEHHPERWVHVADVSRVFGC